MTYSRLKPLGSNGEGVYILVEVFLFQLLGGSPCWWTRESPEAHVAKFYDRLRLICCVLRASKFSELKLSEIVILNVYPFNYTIFAVSGKVLDPVNRFNHTSGVGIVTSTDHPKLVRNRCVIQVFCGVFVLSRCFSDFSVGIGAFVIGLSHISSFLWVYYTIPFGFTLFRYLRGFTFDLFFKLLVWLRITDEGSVPKIRIWSIL